MDDDLAHQAIQAAIAGDWKTAQRLNKTILKDNPHDIDSILRLANALAQLGNRREAEKQYLEVIKVDPHNVFAQRGLLRLKKLKGTDGDTTDGQYTLSNSFLEEPGKTKTITLVYPAYEDVTMRLATGEPVILEPRRRRISVTTHQGKYVGRLPDDLSLKLLGFIRGGNRYEAIIKSVNQDQVKVFIRETFRASRFAITPSFPADMSTLSDE